MKILLGAFILIIAIGLFLFWTGENTIEVVIPASSVSLKASETVIQAENSKSNQSAPKPADIENQKPLAEPPKIIKAIYLTSWSAGNPAKIKYLIDLTKTTEINAVVIDIKDYSGYVAYDIQAPEVEKYQAKEIRIPRINRLIKQLHDAGIYIIARITIFQDPRLEQARPDLAIKSKKTGSPWLDNKKLSWIDPAAEEAWNYNIAIARETADRGFDELNFDYIRFPSDGDLDDMDFSFWQKTPIGGELNQANAETKSEVIKNFFKTLRRALAGIKISADLFGLATINKDDLGIGQVIENAYQYFDYVSPMVYPSHYASGFLGYQNPALYPYEVVKYSLDSAIKRLISYSQPLTATSTVSSTIKQRAFDYPMKSKIRPWLQDFDLGANYDAEMIKKETQAVLDSLGDNFNGWMMWNPSNIYTQKALESAL